MTITITLDEAGAQLKDILRQLTPGDTVTLTEANGTPRAVLVGISPAASPETVTDWSQQWGKLSTQIDQAWQSEQSAKQILAEMRR